MKKTLGLVAAVLALGLAACTSSYTAPKADENSSAMMQSSSKAMQASSPAAAMEASSAIAK